MRVLTLALPLQFGKRVGTAGYRARKEDIGDVGDTVERRSMLRGSGLYSTL